MKARFLASESGTAPSWLYTRPAFGRTGRSLSENNFAKEKRNWVAILLREILQNGLDARRSTSTAVTVRLAEQQVSPNNMDYVRKLLTVDHIARFNASVSHIKDVNEISDRFLVIEDFGTTGLTGVTHDPDIDGAGQNWNAFWFREGEGGKEQGAGNGGAGQGKITYFSTSEIRTIFAYTVRNDDLSEALYGASSFLRDYEYNSTRTLRDAYWGVEQKRQDDTIAIPTTDPATIAEFREKFGITRQTAEAGLSLVIPAPMRFNIDQAVEVTIAEFFTPILRGDLIVQIGETTLDANTIMEVANLRLSDIRARELYTCTTKGFREFVAAALIRSQTDEVALAPVIPTMSDLCDASFGAENLERLRLDLQNGKQISVRFPLKISPKGREKVTCFFDVHLMCPSELEHVEQAIIRRDLLIGEEPIGGGSLRQRARGLTLINDRELSKLLLSAEEATHLRWNTKLPRLREYYRSGAEAVAFVRNAMARLLEVLTGGEQKRDFRLLAKFFPAPGMNPQLPQKGRKSPEGKNPIEIGKIPSPVSKKLALHSLIDGVRVTPSKVGSLLPSDMPVHGHLEFAYEGLDKDAFAEYTPLDFEVSDSYFRFGERNCTTIFRENNIVQFQILDPDFLFEVAGFDTNLRLRVRLKYEECANATIIDAE